MEKGKYGIRYGFYGVVAFLFAIFGWTTALVLLAGVVIIGEKDEWASRQVIEALCLCVVSSLIYAFFDIFDFFYRIPFFGGIWSTIISVISSLVSIGVLIFAIIAISKNAKGQEAGVPIASKFANWAYGKVVVKPQPVYQQPVQGQPAYQQPVQGQPVYQQPVQQAQPVQQPVQPVPQPAPAADACANCGAPLNGAAFCTKCGTPVNK